MCTRGDDVKPKRCSADMLLRTRAEAGLGKAAHQVGIESRVFQNAPMCDAGFPANVPGRWIHIRHHVHSKRMRRARGLAAFAVFIVAPLSVYRLVPS